MKLALICLCALMLCRFLPQPRRWHPIAGFDWLVRRVETFCYGPTEWGIVPRLFLGLLALILVIVPPASIAWTLSVIPYVGVAVEIGLLYLALPLADLRKEVYAAAEALRRRDIDQAREQVGKWVEWDTDRMDEETISLAAVETVLKGGYKVLVGALFWFLIAGVVGAVVYRLIDAVHERWGYSTPRYGYFGWSTAWLHYGLNWIPIRLTAFSYLLLGDRETAWQCWRRQTKDSLNGCYDGVVLAAGAGALNLQLGGVVFYFGGPVTRPSWGDGLLPRAQDIDRALHLLDRMLVLWIGLLGLGIGFFTCWRTG